MFLEAATFRMFCAWFDKKVRTVDCGGLSPFLFFFSHLLNAFYSFSGVSNVTHVISDNYTMAPASMWWCQGLVNSAVREAQANNAYVSRYCCGLVWAVGIMSVYDIHV